MEQDRTALRRQMAAGDLAELKVEALLVTSRSNVRYLSGFTGSNGWLLLFASADAVFYTDPRYTVQASQQVSCRVRVAKKLISDEVMKEVRRRRVRRVGVEQDSLTIGRFEALTKMLPAGARLVPVADSVALRRMVKDEEELALIRASVQANSLAFDAAARNLKPGMSEMAFAAEIDYQNRRMGAEGLAFDTIVASGKRAALPHARPGRHPIEPGMVLVDMGAFRDGYASDMTRMLHLGKAGSSYRRAYKAVLEAQLAAIDAVRAGVSAGRVDRAARDVLKGYGIEKEFVHSTGHGLGLDIHEAPRLGRREKTKLREGMAVTIEPGIYREGWGGIRIEDTILVTRNGCEILTPTPKTLIEI